MFSGDLSERAGISPAFDTYVDAALKRFQSRHGLPADGVTSEYTFAAMNVSTQVRLGQLETNLVRLNSMASGHLGDRYVMVNIPAAQIEAVENGRVVRATRQSSARSTARRRSWIRRSRDHRQSLLERAGRSCAATSSR
jgi:L,D-transpeptidase YcbB